MTPAQITEEMLAAFFDECGPVMDVRVCGDANQDLRFAFLEFAEERSVEPVRAPCCLFTHARTLMGDQLSDRFAQDLTLKARYDSLSGCLYLC